MKAINFILNEKQYIENILKLNTFNTSTDSIKKVITMLCKYYNNDVNTDKDIYQLVKNTLNNMDIIIADGTPYQAYKFENTIKNTSKKVILNNYHLTDIDYIPLYNSEHKYIENNCIKDREKKILFTCYIVARYMNCGGYVNISDSKVFELANITLSAQKRDFIIGELREKGFLELCKRNDKDNFKINLLDDNGIYIKVYNIKNLGNQYLGITKKGYRTCINCGKLIKINSNNQKYCSKCILKINSINNINRIKKCREKKHNEMF